MPLPDGAAADGQLRWRGPGRRTRAALAAGAAVGAELVAERRIVLGFLVGAQWLGILAFALTVRHNGWIFYQGGDQIWHTTGAWLLGHGDLPPTHVGYGWSIVLAPIMLATGSDYVGALPAIVLLNVLVLGPLALVALYGLATRIAGVAFGLFAAALWVVAPFLAIPFWRDDYNDRYVEQFLPQALGLTAMADYPSLVALLVAAWLLVRALRGDSWTDAAAAGLVAGFALGIKPSNALFLAGPALMLLVAWRPRPTAAFAAGLLPALVTLVVWKQRGLGDLPLIAFPETRLAAGATVAALDLGRYVDLDWSVLHQNADSLREYFWSARVLEWLPLAGAIAVARRSLPLAALLSAWFAAFLVVKGTTELSTVQSGSFLRLLLPGFPAYFLLAAAVPLLVPTLGPRIAAAAPPPALRPLGRRVLLALAVALAVVPLVPVALARPLDDNAEAVRLNEILTPVDPAIELRATREGEAVVLEWTDAIGGRSDVFYRVFRTAAGGLDTHCEAAAAAECRVELLLLGTTRERSFRDGSPPPGSLYRVGIGANWRDDPSGREVFAVSPPFSLP